MLSWYGDHPVTSPQSSRSEVQHIFNLLFLIGCFSVCTSGLGVGFWFVEVFVNSFVDDLAYIGDVEVCMECVI